MFFRYWPALVFVFGWALVFLNHAALDWSFLNSDVAVWLKYVDLIQTTNKEMYRDIFEINFPTSFLFYYPIYFVSQAGIPNGLSVLLFGFSFSLIIGIISFLINERLGNFLFPAIGVWVVASVDIIGQREFFAALLIMPALGLFLLGKSKFSLLRIIVFGLAIIAVLIKPIFLLPVFLAWFASLEKKFSRDTGIDVILAIFLLILGIACLYYLFPYFFEITLLYMFDYSGLSGNSAAYHVYAIGIILTGIVWKLSGSRSILFWASLGFLLVTIIQMKGYFYHLQPLILISLISLFYSLGHNKIPPVDKWSISLVFLLIVSLPFSLSYFKGSKDKEKLYLFSSQLQKYECGANTVLLTGLPEKMNLISNEIVKGTFSPSSSVYLLSGENSNVKDYNLNLILDEIKGANCLVYNNKLIEKSLLDIDIKVEKAIELDDLKNYKLLKL